MRCVDYQILAMRLILAFLSDDLAEAQYHCWAIADQSGCDQAQFQVAARAAYECASWWREVGMTDEARDRIAAKLERLTEVAA